ncbi:MAG TPA: TonB-dependent receptor, partial [Thermoanaerobaculia bacterium]
MVGKRAFRTFLLLCLVVLIAPLTFAQQTGSISGRVTATDGSALPGVTVEARSTVLPQPRVTTTDENGDYRLPALQPGRYTLTFSLSGMDSTTRDAQVLLGQNVTSNAALGVAGVSESITVTAQSTLLDTSSNEIKSAVSSESIENLPVGQDYRDLVKLAPAVQYSEEAVRGPSAGGSGQDNVYQFDGVNVNLPLFGTLSAEPSSHDIQQVSVVKGGARAMDFNRSAGFTIDSVSKSGTSKYMGELTYQTQRENFTADRTFGSTTTFEQDRSWITANFGGPILRDRLFFYGSYYHPEKFQENRANSYGEVPDYESTRDELFGKLTYTPLGSVLINGSYRHSDREDVGTGVTLASTAGTASSGTESGLRIGILEASWVINNRSYVSGKFTDFANLTLDRPDLLLDVTPTLSLGAHIDPTNLTSFGRLTVPTLLANTPANAAANAFRQGVIDRYGFLSNNVRTGGGIVGPARDITDNDFYRTSWQVAYDHTLGTGITHDLHAGYQWVRDEEDLARTYNGFGDISVQGGSTTCPTGSQCAGQPVFYTARFIRAGLADATLTNIHSEYVANNIELNDNIRLNDWSFNVGVMLSEDTLYGQGLREADTLSGFVSAPGNKYEMYKIPFSKMIQPRLGATWAYNG